jgi:hypothetical protein
MARRVGARVKDSDRNRRGERDEVADGAWPVDLETGLAVRQAREHEESVLLRLRDDLFVELTKIFVFAHGRSVRSGCDTLAWSAGQLAGRCSAVVIGGPPGQPPGPVPGHEAR